MKTATIFGLVLCLLTLATHAQAEEHFIYRDPQGRLVISNKPPPNGSDVLGKLALIEGKVQQPQEGGDVQLNWRAEGSGKTDK
jgi:hypothetical protein